MKNEKENLSQLDVFPDNIQIIKGDLIELAKSKTFDVIAHGCNCQSVMGAGIAPLMADAFGCDQYPLELLGPNDYKLGLIDFKHIMMISGVAVVIEAPTYKHFTVVNAYTQLSPRIPDPETGIPLSYRALKEALALIEKLLGGKGVKLGLPWIGCGLARGDKALVLAIIKEVFENSLTEVYIVEYDR
jgi:O-acetyl-ADP-ribose deacetylase (regulator of RNase III)